MTETFVDLMYRGLPLGRRIKLTQVRPHNGYLEHPTPMPVGSAISIATDDGFVLDAVVASIHEQVGGSDVAPGMLIKPALASDQMTSWWKARVTLPEVDPPKSDRPKQITVRPRSHTVPEPIPTDAPTVPTAPAPSPPRVPEPAAVEVKKTTVMNAVDQDLLEQLTKNPDEIERLTSKSGDYAVVDDGQRTMVMQAVDPAALGLDVTMSGSFPTVGDDEDDDEPSPAESGPAGDKPKPAVKKRKKRR